jgi:hypothetical protein
MPHPDMRRSISIDEGSGFVLVELNGPTSVDDVIAAFEELGTRFAGMAVKVVVDMNGADLRFDTGAVRTIAQRTPVFARIGIVASDDAKYGMARAYQTYGTLLDNGNIRVFRSRSQAIDWAQAP